MDVPFRVGHTLIGVPFQLALGAAAGAFGFFTHSAFVMVEGMAETLLGAATAYAYPKVSAAINRTQLSKVNVTDSSDTKA